MISLLPQASLDKLQHLLGSEFRELTPEDVQALITADVEGKVTNSRLRQFSGHHATDITRRLQGLVSKGLLEKNGHGRAATYCLAGRASTPIISTSETEDSGKEPRSGYKEPRSGYKEPRSGYKEPTPEIVPTSDPYLLAIAEPARRNRRLQPQRMQPLIRHLCTNRFLTFRELATLLNREPNGLRRSTLRPMAEDGQLRMRYRETPNHPSQAYQTNPEWVDDDKS